MGTRQFPGSIGIADQNGVSNLLVIIPNRVVDRVVIEYLVHGAYEVVPRVICDTTDFWISRVLVQGSMECDIGL